MMLKLNIKKIPVVLGLFTIILTIAQLSACNEFPRNKTHKEVPGSSIRRGKKLAATYCQSCHMLPDPSMLDVKSWEKGVLPNMGPHLGIHEFNYQEYPSSRNDVNVGPDHYPSQPVIKPEEWQDIINYYTATSPDTLIVQPDQPPIRTGLKLFAPQVPGSFSSGPVTSFVQINSRPPQREVVISSLSSGHIFRFDRQLNKVDSVRTDGPVVNMDIQGESFLATNIGMLNPNNGKAGSGQFYRLAGNRLTADPSLNFGELGRPVQISRSDFNGDGRQDYLICEFGFVKGGLSWMENRGSQGFKKHIIRSFPGSAKAIIRDENKDGSPDIWVLFTQGEEGIFLFTNDGKGNFSTREVLRFPPMYGSSSFDLADFDGDGSLDIIYTCGDNADYSPVFKPYHGVYIFTNNGKNEFKKQFFYQINGCYKAIAEDFDGDGDQDIATIAYFADYEKKPEEGFVYFENDRGKLKPFTIPETMKGRWLTMDSGDLDGDGRTDLVLGNFSIGPIMRKPAFNWREGPPFMVLRNLGK